MNRARILFVDDESDVLNGLRDLLRKERQRWDMVFAVGGEQALAELQKAPFDVVVSDMRMPGMDGAELLGRVKAEYPGTARLVLSGHAEREATLRAVSVVQQFLSKPCDAGLLRTTIERTCGLHKLLESPAIRAVVGGMEKLPSVPRAASDPASDMTQIAGIVQRDPAMCAKVLQLVNSAYFGIGQNVVSIPQAVSLLGTELVKGLTLTADAFAAMHGEQVECFSIERLRDHSVLTARLAKSFLAQSKLADEAFTAALVHDVGKIVLALGMPDRFASAIAESRSSGRPFHVVEEELLGISHAEVGAYLLGVWGLPFSIVETTAYHHRPGRVAEGRCDVLAAVHAADALGHAPSSEQPADSDAGLDLEFLERSGHAAQLPRWREMAREMQMHGDRAAASRVG
jgi:HD-like signal output (HDOD) protein/ActR/RegA family two-component response regulator